MDFWGCEGSGATFHGLRMRSRSRRKCAHRNAGDLGSRLAVCACAYDPIHVTAQSKRLGPHCACVQSLHHYRGLPMNACVLYPMGSRGFSWPYMGIVTSIGSPDLNARFWLVDKIFAALWLVSAQRGQYYYYNSLIRVMDKLVFYKSWYQMGISQVNQIVKEKPSTFFLSPTEFEKKVSDKGLPFDIL